MDDTKRINDALAAFPADIYAATQITEAFRESWLLEEARKDFEAARAFLKAKTENLTEGMAKARATEAVYVTAQEVIRAESAFRRALADQVRLENEYTSIRKQANLHEALIQRLGGLAA